MGWVRAKPGDYTDALSKKNGVILLGCESTGGSGGGTTGVSGQRQRQRQRQQRRRQRRCGSSGGWRSNHSERLKHAVVSLQ